MIQIDQTLHLGDGQVVISTGAVVSFDILFKTERRDTGSDIVYDQYAEIPLSLYGSLSDYEANKPAITQVPDEFDSLYIRRLLTSGEYASLETDSGVLSMVQGWVQDEIEAFSGITTGNTSIVTPT